MAVNAAPLSLEPSGEWEGNDGNWSTYHVELGVPRQTVRLLPGTSATATNTIWTVLDEGCTLAAPDLPSDVCYGSRGGTFDRNSSSTWSTSRLLNGGLYELQLFEESKLGYAANAYEGFEVVQLGLPNENQNRPTIYSQLIAGFADDDFWIGSLGLSPLAINLTNFNTPLPSLLQNLKDSNSTPIPSLSWGYAAGANYKSPPDTGSLVLGGYDIGRFDPARAISVPFGKDQSRDLEIQLRSIEYDTVGGAPLMTTSGYFFVDSLVSSMWLPLEVCQQFERAFGLVYDEDYEFYLLNATRRATLLQQNPTFTFNIASPADSTQTTDITIPYAAFDLNVSYPFVNSTTAYFPLQRAQNTSQYVLGRAFLQEAYLVADYERKNFTIGQVAVGNEAAITAISPITPARFTQSNSESESLSKGAIAGIGVGVGMAVSMVLGLLLWIVLRRRRRATASVGTSRHELAGHGHSSEKDSFIPELGGPSLTEAPATEKKQRHELTGSHDRIKAGRPSPGLYELPGHEVRAELPGIGTNPKP